MNIKMPFKKLHKTPINISKFGGKLVIVIVLLSLFIGTGSAAISYTPDGEDSNDVISSIQTIFGVEEMPIIYNGELTTELTSITNSKTKWVRGPAIVWSDIEAVENDYDWSKLQPAIDELDEIINLGYTPIVVVRGTPSWAQFPDSSTCGPIKADRFDDFGTFIQDAMDELSDKGIYVQFWEIWNEPDVDPSLVPEDSWYAGCWGDVDDDFYGGRYYSKMLTVVYQMIKSKDPYAQVLVGGLNLYCDPIDPHPDCDPKPAKFFQGVLIDGIGNNFDGVSYHAYDGYGGEYGTYGNIWWKSFWNSTGPSLIAKASYIRALMQGYGVMGKYLMSTETTLICDPCNDDPTFEATKANYLADSYASAVAYGLAANIWFDILGTWGRNNGLVDQRDLSGLPALDAYNFASEMLEGAMFVRAITEFEGVFGYEFKTPNPSYHVWMVRSIDGQNYPIELVFPPVAVYDVYGNELTASNNLDVSVEPMYIVMPAAVPRIAITYSMNYFKNFGNGDFEDGVRGWLFINNGLPPSLVSENPTNPATGSPDTNIPIGDYSAQLGMFGYDCNSGSVPIGFAAINQQFFVPDTPGNTVTLEFKYIIYSEDKAPGPPLEPNDFDRFEVYVLSASGSELSFSDANKSTSYGCNNWTRVPTTGWGSGSINLDSYQGESVYISFRNYNRTDGYYNTVTYLDDVELKIVP